MKTVMKKMFSLLLVAVMLVGVMPFQAFADGANLTVYRNDQPYSGGSLDTGVPYTVAGLAAEYANGEYDAANTQLHIKDSSGNNAGQYGADGSFTLDPAHTSVTLYLFGPNCSHCQGTHSIENCSDYCDNCQTGGHDEGAQHCSNCQLYHALADCPTYCSRCNVAGHDDNDPSHCTSCGAYGDNHASDCDTLKCPEGCGAAKHENTPCCSTCEQNGHQASACPNCEICAKNDIINAKNPNHVHCTICEGLNGAHGDNCDNNPNKVKTCTKCNRTYRDADGAHVCCDRCKELHATANCPYCSVCWGTNGANKVTAHKASDHCSECKVVDGHKTGCTKAYPATGNSKLHVWANLIVGNSEKETILLDTITGLSGSDLTYQVVARNEARLRSKIPNGYSWTGHVYFEQDPDTAIKVSSTMTISDDDDVVINLYTDQKLVVARIHTSKSFTVDRLVDVGGFQIGDTITSNDVLKAVKKHYSVSSMKMYTPGDWETIVQGGSASVLPNFKVVGGDNIVDVYLVGSRISSSSTSYTADSSNPKTGDTIFAPIAIMGLSVSALAVLFYLNKKRAY